MLKTFEELLISSDDVESSTNWRSLIIIEPNSKVGLLGEFTSDLTRSYFGEVIIGIFVHPNQSGGHDHMHPLPEEATAIETLRAAYEAFDADRRTIYRLVLFRAAPEDRKRQLLRFISEKSIDFVLMRSSNESSTLLRDLPCTTAIMRGSFDQLDPDLTEHKIERILIPSSGGPNTISALELLSKLSSSVEITTLYVVDEGEDSTGLALGYSTLNSIVSLADCEGSVDTKVISTGSVVNGITKEAEEAYDLVILGASEGTVDRVLFGNVVESVVRDSNKPVMVMRRPRGSRFYGNNRFYWQLRQIFPKLSRDARSEIYAGIRRQSRAEVNFYVLIALSAAIAGAGLLLNSPAVVIGAMLVAPLMSPIVGTGMAMVLGESRFLQVSLASVLRGALLAIGVGCMVGLIRFGQPLTSEVLARTSPSLLDLAVALFSGMAAAYALCYAQAAGALPGVAIAAALVPPLAVVGITFVNGYFRESLGALLLFLTNFLTIASAAATVFFGLGFRPVTAQKARIQVRQRTLRIAVALLFINAAILGWTTYNLAFQNARNAAIYNAVEGAIATVTGDDASISNQPNDFNFEVVTNEENLRVLQISAVARSPRNIFYTEVVEIQDQIGAGLEERYDFDKIGLELVVVRITKLDPAIPPTPTPTPTE